MAKILIATFGSFGDIDPYLGLAIALQERGHEATIATSEYYRDYVVSRHVGFHGVRPDISPDDREMVARIMDPKRGTDYLLREVVLPTLRESYDDLAQAVNGVDLLVTHPLTFAGPILAEQREFRWVSSVLAPISFFSRYDTPVYPPAPWLKRVERVVPPLGPLLVTIARLVIRRWSAPVRSLRRALDLPPGSDPIFEGQHSPDAVLALFSRVLAQPQPDWPPNVTLTGNIFFGGEDDAGLGTELEQFLQDGPPPIVFTLGSAAVHAAGDFYEESAEAIRRLGKRAVLLVGSKDGKDPAQPLPNGVLAIDFAPFSLLFPRAAAVVHHGGIGTTMQAVRAGRPALIVPFAHDQADNAYRLSRLGAARTLPLMRYRARTLAAELTALLSGEYPKQAAALGEVVRAEDGAAAACLEIERCLEQRPDQ